MILYAWSVFNQQCLYAFGSHTRAMKYRHHWFSAATCFYFAAMHWQCIPFCLATVSQNDTSAIGSTVAWRGQTLDKTKQLFQQRRIIITLSGIAIPETIGATWSLNFHSSLPYSDQFTQTKPRQIRHGPGSYWEMTWATRNARSRWYAYPPHIVLVSQTHLYRIAPLWVNPVH